MTYKRIFLSLLAVLLVLALTANPVTVSARGLESQSTGTETIGSDSAGTQTPGTAKTTGTNLSSPSLLAGELPPALPSSFYGTIKKADGQNLPVGTQVEAKINGVTVATALTQLYNGSSVYTIDVKGSTGVTPADGGVDGNVIQFVAGQEALVQTGTWHSGTIVNLNLDAYRKVFLPVVTR